MRVAILTEYRGDVGRTVAVVRVQVPCGLEFNKAVEKLRDQYPILTTPPLIGYTISPYHSDFVWNLPLNGRLGLDFFDVE